MSLAICLGLIARLLDFIVSGDRQWAHSCIKYDGTLATYRCWDGTANKVSISMGLYLHRREGLNITAGHTFS
jgi:hypothetical protein